jgi:hypothetical protein
LSVSYMYYLLAVCFDSSFDVCEEKTDCIVTNVSIRLINKMARVF